jgi:outer membrane protein OmpA-like peptidoglycan-associated protein
MHQRNPSPIKIRARNERRRWVATILASAVAIALSGCASYWESNRGSWRSGDTDASEPRTLRSTEDAHIQPPSTFVTASNNPDSEFGRNMGVREFQSDWTYGEAPAVPGGFQTHQRVQRLSFAVGSAALDREAHGALMQVRDQLKANTRWHLLVVGMADKEQESGMNADRLSEKRAQTVKNWLLQQGIDADRISTTAFGSRYATGDQFQPMTMRSDRRVEVWAFM